MKKLIILLFLLTGVLTLTGCSSVNKSLSKKDKEKIYDVRATLKTSKGDINMFLYPEAAPKNVASFIYLAKRGFHDKVAFHRYVEGSVIQGGDPTGTGRGGPGYLVEDEIVDWIPYNRAGVVAMANAGADTNGSQFFITLGPTQELQGYYTVIGELISEDDVTVAKELRDTVDGVYEIIFTGPSEFVVSLHKEEVQNWKDELDKYFTGLKPYEVKSPEEFPDLYEIYSKVK